jgi:group I intron endonuclease
MNKGKIYKVISPNGEVYIGQTVESLGRRMNRHIRMCQKGEVDIKFYRNLRKYGWENFKWEVIYKDISEELLDIAEMCAIYIYDSYYNGLNSTLGGDINPMKCRENVEKMIKTCKNRGIYNNRKPLSEETKNKISQTQKNKYQNEKVWNKGLTSADDPRILSGYKHPMSGKHHSDDAKLKISQNRIYVSGVNNPTYGRKHSPETIEKIRLSKLNRSK